MPYWSIVNIKIEKIIFDLNRDHAPLNHSLIIVAWYQYTIHVQFLQQQTLFIHKNVKRNVYISNLSFKNLKINVKHTLTNFQLLLHSYMYRNLRWLTTPWTAESYLLMINCMMGKKYTSQMGGKMSSFG